jgi:hypothetical protein
VAAQGASLFNLARAPGETKNVAAANPAKAKEMEVKIAAFEKNLGPVPPGKFIRSDADRSLSSEQNKD